MLRSFGARIGRNVHIYPSAKIYIPWNLEMGDESSIGEWVLVYNLGQISIGAQATVSHCAHLCAGTHDYKVPSLPLLRPPISVGEMAWVCSNSFVGPGVKIGKGAVVSAGSVVMSDVPPWHIVSGNPAKFLKVRLLGEAAIGKREA